ncbi:uncharacterized protein DNG_02650 [Cephalotrichum gorgonifer]|uniref:Uncharacterized protein n=1 Tax=Cephalotrichum gorgonifer TaxID=2041049 RepID=A0AAE8MUA4_9PEZI|nr:uncharacterized protein DNG_02650 [Cephalotrichum gorgonifer]
MSTAHSFPPGGQSPGEIPTLTVDFGSKNPFRNRAASPAATDFFGNKLSPTPTSPFDDPLPSGRPLSRNPFLDPVLTKQTEALLSPRSMSSQPDRVASPTAEEIFDSLTLDEGKPRRPNGDENRRMNQQPPRPPRRDGPSGSSHRPTQSQEEAMRARRKQSESGGPSRNPGGPSSQSPNRRPERRPRRNSDSSLLIDFEKPLTEEEKKARDARRRERERKSRPSRPNRKVDLIDQLDATGIYGVGAFHHDGPFDACNPHRNRKGSRRAPMSAFAKDSLNNSIGGSGPLNQRPDHKRFMGTADDDAFNDYAARSKDLSSEGVFDSTGRNDILHGDESLGLGTSTFLHGTPAARTMIEKREAEEAAAAAQAAEGLQRKKSLAQRFRGINRGPGGRPSFGEGRQRPTYPELPKRKSDEGRGSGDRSANDEFSNEPETITVGRANESGTKSPTSPSSHPRRPSLSAALERRTTTDGVVATEDGQGRPAPGGGFLARVKSLKGGSRRPRAPSDAPNLPPVPGTAV